MALSTIEEQISLWSKTSRLLLITICCLHITIMHLQKYADPQKQIQTEEEEEEEEEERKVKIMKSSKK